MEYKCLSGNDEKIKDLFLELPEKIYKGEICPQDFSTEKAILDGIHPLSKDFSVVPLVAVDEKCDAAARGLLTFYDDEDSAYLGFFECIDDIEACRALIEKAEETVKEKGKNDIIGPVDSSIWIGYRFKVFNSRLENAYIDSDKPYTGEPWNKPYYTEFWEQCGFSIWKKYYSFRLNKITEKEGKPKYVERVEQFLKKGYEFRNLEIKKFDETIREIYDLLIELYASFPGYRRISYEAFYELFHNLKMVLSADDVILIYKDQKLAAFSISVPNFYENLFGRMTFIKLLKVLWIKRSPKEMVYLYMGVDPSHLGLGSVMAELIRRELYRNGRVPIKALILENKATGAYYNDLLDEKMEYVLLIKEQE
ncbi:hypothetical protein UYO_1029 [Lachnospiraceae bacterium JC7]|nr:hypothetical protein UYO_1029 [Lachnospiraceae bacterium JC7]